MTKRTPVDEAVKRALPFEAFVHSELVGLDPVLDVKRFSLYYTAARALWDITMQIPRGKVTALIGPSGCGKSTLLRSVNRLNDLIDGVRTEGEMLLNGRPVFAPDVDVIDLRKRIGMVFQKSNPFPMSIYENVIYPLRIDGERRRSVLDDAVERSLRAAALWDEAKNRLKDSALGLSGGQQRLCIARAISAEPKSSSMDEPQRARPLSTSKSKNSSTMRDRYTVVIVTHNMQQASRVSDFTAFMYLGRLVEFGPTPPSSRTPPSPRPSNTSPAGSLTPTRTTKRMPAPQPPPARLPGQPPRRPQRPTFIARHTRFSCRQTHARPMLRARIIDCRDRRAAAASSVP